jgi:dTMP kinase
MDCPNSVAGVRQDQRSSPAGVIAGPVARTTTRPLHRSSLVLGALPTAVSCARLHTKLVVWEWRLLVDADTVQLLVSELVTNSVKAAEAVQGRPPIGLRLSASDALLLIEVWDGDLTPPVPPDLTGGTLALDAEGGRGLLLVEALSDRWGWYTARNHAGKVTWCEVGTALIVCQELARYRSLSTGQETAMTALTPSPFPEDKQSPAQEATRDPRLTIPVAGGFFAVIDGPSGVGKTTVTALTVARLGEGGAPVLATRQPSDSSLGRLARSGTHDLHGLPLTYLMAADRHHHYEQVILPALNAGQVVLCDRYVPTALVLDQIDGADPKFVWSLYRSLGWPHLAIVLTGSPAVCHARAQRRGVYSRFHEGGLSAAETEASLYASTAVMLGALGYPIHVVSVDGLSADEVADHVTTLISDRMSDSKTAPR